jgi:AraC-like DNA-binding protein
MPMLEKSNKFPHIFYSCYSRRSKDGEQFVPQHVFSYILSGTSEVYSDGKTYHFKEGDFRFIRKNQLSRFIKIPSPGGEYRSISIYIDDEILKCVSEEFDLHMAQPYQGENILYLKPNDLLTYYFDSLGPYMIGTYGTRDALTSLKVREAIMILIETNPELKDALFDFNEPGKIDLEEYMNGHFQYNVSLDRFAYLTGRSLSTFHRDFKRVFNTTPGHWLLKKRLNEAYYQIREKGLKVSDVYLQVGFEDLSHFSSSFKKAFGIAPSLVSAYGQIMGGGATCRLQ